MEETKMTLTVPDEWHRSIKVEAALRGMTIKDIVITSVNEWLENNPLRGGKS